MTINSSGKLTKALLLGFGANAFGQIVTLIGQVLQLPVFLHSYGVALTGEWLLLSAVPTYILLSDIGLSNVAANEMSMAMSSGRTDDARRLLHSLCRFIATIGAVLAVVVLALGWGIDWPRVWGLKELSRSSASATLGFMCLGAVVSLSSGLFYGLYRACNQGPRIYILMNLARLIELLTWIGSAALRLPFPTIAVIQLLVRIMNFLLIWYDARRQCTALPLGFSEGRWSEVWTMIRPAIAFMAFPVGNALYFQGITFVVNATLGTTSVVIYNACRIFSRGVPLVISTIRLALWTEYPHLYARGEMEKLRQLQRMAAGLAWAVMVFSIPITIPFGPTIIGWWTLGKVEISGGLLCLFVMVACVNGLWNMMSTLLMALNRHESFAKYYLVSMTAAVLFSYFLAAQWGLAAIGCVLLAAEIPLCWYTLARASELVEEKPRTLLWSMFTGAALKEVIVRLRSGITKGKSR